MTDPLAEYPFGYEWYPRRLPDHPVFHTFTPGELAAVEQMREGWNRLIDVNLTCSSAACLKLGREPAALWSDLFQCYFEADDGPDARVFDAAAMATLVMHLAEIKIARAESS